MRNPVTVSDKAFNKVVQMALGFVTTWRKNFPIIKETTHAQLHPDRRTN